MFRRERPPFRYDLHLVVVTGAAAAISLATWLTSLPEADYQHELQATAGQLLFVAALDEEPLKAKSNEKHRTLRKDFFLKSLMGKPKAPVEIVFSETDEEAFQLAKQFHDLLHLAAWEVSDPIPIGADQIAFWACQLSSAVVSDQLYGVAVAMRAESQDEFRVYRDRDADTPLNALLEAILETIGSVNLHVAGPDIFSPPPAGTIRLVVGTKP